ncbi:MAG: transglycosylase domain-containing protein, partial [Bacillota bacterium]|nr:transglycosylase domain-containing protein [Bacillota bacterium]
MSDKYNDFNDDFFSKFDEIANASRKDNVGTDTYSADDGAEEFMYKPDRSGKSGSSRAGRAASGADTSSSDKRRGKRSSRSEKQKAKDAARSAKEKAVQHSKSAKAKAIAASSKFGGSASGSAGHKTVKPESGGKVLFKSLLCAGLCLVFAVGIYVGFIFLKAPAVDTDDLYSHISQRSVMYDENGKEIENLYFSNGNRTVIKYKDIPENMVNAVIAIEDQKFEHHHGFNFIRMVGAVKDSIFGGGEISGTSTVTQQLARNVYLAEIKSQRSLSRKLTEMYCTIVLEKKLSKEQIMEAYLNTIYLGFNSYGVEAAAESYFNTKAKNLNLEQCAALAALPQSPDTYALVYSDYYNSMTSLPKIKKTETVTYRYNGDRTTDRRQLVLNNMCSMGFISEQERDTAVAKANDLEDEIKIGTAVDEGRASYFTDYCLKQLTADLMKEFNLSESDAENMIYTKGLKIYTSMDSNIQNIMEEEFDKDGNYTSISYTRTNADGNIVSDQGVVLAYKYGYYFNDKDSFVLKKNEYRSNSDGGITLLKNKRLNFFSTETDAGTDISVEFKGMFKQENGNFYFIESGALSIPQEYKSIDGDGNCVISGQFFTDYPDFFKKGDGGYTVADENYSLKQKVRQPQAAAVIIENSTGEVKGMMGGRGATGKQLYNRAVNPRQPGSSIKPLAVYGPALQMSFEYHEANKKLALDTSEGSDWGRYITAGSVINDALTKDGNGKVWPLNDDHGYHGPKTFREALQMSLNVCSYKIYKQIDMNEGAQYSLDMMKKSGITTLNDEADANPAAISLGGLTKGLSPLEETAAYAVFPNKGVYKTPIFYTKVLDSNGNLKYENKTEETQVYDPGVAWIMTDVLRSVVTNGIGRSASISSQPAAGKTGTTSNMYDIWFSGFTPQYSMALWMGNDINMSVSNYSYKAAQFWAAIMGRVCADIPRGSYFDKPANVISVGGEYFIDGTYSKVTKKKSKTTKEDRDEDETTTTIPTEPSIEPTAPPI